MYGHRCGKVNLKHVKPFSFTFFISYEYKFQRMSLTTNCNLKYSFKMHSKEWKKRFQHSYVQLSPWIRNEEKQKHKKLMYLSHRRYSIDKKTYTFFSGIPWGLSIYFSFGSSKERLHVSSSTVQYNPLAIRKKSIV